MTETGDVLKVRVSFPHFFMYLLTVNSLILASPEYFVHVSEACLSA